MVYRELECRKRLLVRDEEIARIINADDGQMSKEAIESLLEEKAAIEVILAYG